MIEDIESAFSAIGLPSELLPVAIALAFLGTVGPGLTFVFRVVRAVARWATGLPIAGKSRRDRLKRKDVRQRFAHHVEGLIDELNKAEQWTDQRYTDLEAEIEMQGEDALRIPLIKYLTPRHRLRRTGGLSKALARSSADLIMLLGGAGSGKSVALRYLARRLARRAAGSSSVNTTIPIYVNLRHLERRGREIDAGLIEEFVVESFSAHSNRTVDDFVKEEFKPRLEDPTWLFLFDSFDEIPEILGSTGNDEVIKGYSKAIEDFTRFRSSRCIVASRDFRRPQELNSQTWTIAPLSERKKRELIKKAKLPPDENKRLKKWLPTAPDGISLLCSTPLFLSLVCDYVREARDVPANRQQVFDSFAQRRLKQAATGSGQGAGAVSQEEVRDMAERIALVMAAVDGLGLSPRRSRLLDVLGFASTAERETAEGAMDALQRVRLARGRGHDGSNDPSFEFVHRRFAEYFATEVVRNRPDLLRHHGLADGFERRLLLDGRWRETAVTLCQSGDTGMGPLLEQADAFAGAAAEQFPELDSERLEKIERGEIPREREHFVWPEGLYHVLALLQAGFPTRKGVPQSIQSSAGRCLVPAFERGRLYDQYWALEVAGTAQDQVFTGLLRAAFQARNELPKEPAYRQVARLDTVPDDIARSIRGNLVRMATDGTLRADALSVKAQLLRFRRRRHFLAALNLLRFAWWVDVVAHIFVFVWLMRIGDQYEHSAAFGICVLVALFASWSAPSVLRITSPGLLLYIRSVVVFMLVGLIAFFSFSRTTAEIDMPLALAMWSLFALTFAPTALVAVLHGHMLRWPQWPFVHLALLPAAWRLVRANVKATLLLLAVISGGILLVAGVSEGVNALPDVIALPVGGLFALGYGGWLTWVAWRAVHARWSDRRWYEAWESSERGEVVASRVLDWLASQRTRAGAIRLVNAVRAKALLKDDRDAPDVFADLERYTEIVLATKKSEPIDMTPRTAAFAGWLDEAPSGRRKRLREFDQPFLDELAFLTLTLQKPPSVVDDWAAARPAPSVATPAPARVEPLGSV